MHKSDKKIYKIIVFVLIFLSFFILSFIINKIPDGVIIAHGDFIQAIDPIGHYKDFFILF